jgi:hypothetical protein
MALSNWATGWASETVANNRPFLEDMNCVDYVFSYFLKYILTLGVPEYDAGTTYYLNSICQYNGTLYQCINDDSGTGISGILPTNTTNWALLISYPVPFSSQNVVTGSRVINGIYQNTSGKTMTVTIGTMSSADATSIGVVYCDGSTTPTTQVGGRLVSSVGADGNATFIVPVGYYYRLIGVQNVGSIVITNWTEWY